MILQSKLLSNFYVALAELKLNALEVIVKTTLTG